MDWLPMGLAAAGVLLGALGALVPGFPGSAVALLGAVAFAAVTDFAVLGPDGLLVATAIALAATFAQWAGPIAATRATGGSAGVATGAALGAILGAFVPFPGAAWGFAVLGALTLGLLLSRYEIVSWVRGFQGTIGGCLVAIGADLLGVLGIAAVIGFADFWHHVTQLPA